jgi:hypothetical protein
MDLPTYEMMRDRVNALGYHRTELFTAPLLLERGWVYGVWYCGTSFTKKKLYGQYPKTFVKRVSAMFAGLPLLHLCCGVCRIEGAVNVDNVDREDAECPGRSAADYLLDVEALPIPESPFVPHSFGAILIDPPYTGEEAVEHYGQSRLVRPRAVFDQAHELLVPGGFVAWLDERYPRVSRKKFSLFGLISVVTGEERRVRLLSIFESRAASVEEDGGDDHDA